METEYKYWQNSDTPFFIIRQLSFTSFECYDRLKDQWRDYPNGFREVSLNHECHKISEAEADRIITILRSTDTTGMRLKELRELVKAKQ